MANRLAPLTPPFAPDVAAALARYPQRDGVLLSLFRTFANSVRFLKKGVPSLLDADSPLPLRAREIVILRVTANYGCAYEWGVHAKVFAKAAGFSPAHIAATAGDGAAEWTEAEARLIAAVDALCARAALPDALQEGFEADWSLEQQLEILSLVGAYHIVSCVANVARLPPEPYAVPFPAAAA